MLAEGGLIRQRLTRSDGTPTKARKNPSILIIDGNPSNCQTLRTVLTAAGYEVMAANGCCNAAAGQIQTIPHLMVLCHDQPSAVDRKPGKLPAQLSEIPYIACVSSDSEILVEQEFVDGALGCLVSPIHPHQIVATVSIALERAAELEGYRHERAKLTEALEKSRPINVAVGLLMERHNVNQSDAFHGIRCRARSSGRSVLDTSNEILDAFNRLNTLCSVRDEGNACG